MARSEHNRDAYRALFGWVGAGLQALAILLIVISFPVAPFLVVLGLLAFTVVVSGWSWTRYGDNFMMPTFAGVVGAALWMLVIGLGAMVLGWGP
jgi:hypothetical protein